MIPFIKKRCENKSKTSLQKAVKSLQVLFTPDQWLYIKKSHKQSSNRQGRRRNQHHGSSKAQVSNETHSNDGKSLSSSNQLSMVSSTEGMALRLSKHAREQAGSKKSKDALQGELAMALGATEGAGQSKPGTTRGTKVRQQAKTVVSFGSRTDTSMS